MTQITDGVLEVGYWCIVAFVLVPLPWNESVPDGAKEHTASKFRHLNQLETRLKFHFDILMAGIQFSYIGLSNLSFGRKKDGIWLSWISDPGEPSYVSHSNH